MNDLLGTRICIKYECVFCTRSFSRLEHLKRHIVGVHVKKIYICGLCGLVCKKTTDLSQHMKTNHRGQKLKHLCCVCNSHYQTIEELVAHENTKHVCNKMACPDCSCQFKRRDHMLRHYKNVHLKKPVRCEHCKRVFLRKDHLTRHIRVAHSVPFENPMIQKAVEVPPQPVPEPPRTVIEEPQIPLGLLDEPPTTPRRLLDGPQTSILEMAIQNCIPLLNASDVNMALPEMEEVIIGDNFEDVWLDLVN